MRAYAASLFAATLAAGCAETGGVRYVYQDGQFGVVGMPENSDRWPTHYRRRADKLMTAHFPEGHEIVRAEEIVEGSRTVKVEASRTAELCPALPTEVLNVAKLGRTTSSSRADQVKIKECRIIYRKAPRPNADGYAEIATLDPVRYVDSNTRGKGESGPSHAENTGVTKAEPSHHTAPEPPLSWKNADD